METVCNFAALNYNEYNAKGDSNFKNKQNNPEGLGFNPGATHNLGISVPGSQAIPAPMIFSDLFLLIRDTLPQEWQIADSSAPERDLLNGDCNFAALKS